MTHTNSAKPWFDELDEKIFSTFEMVAGKFVPPQEHFLQLVEAYAKGEEPTLEWKCIGRRAPTPETEETNELEADQFTDQENKSSKEEVAGFEFKDETNQFNLSSVRRNATPKGSAKKTKTNSLQSILSNIARHHKIDMLGTKDELKNKLKQQEHSQEHSNQPETLNKHQMLNEENSSQSSGSQTLQDSNINLQNNDIESNSSSLLNVPMKDPFLHNNEMSLEESVQFNNESVDSRDSNQKSTSLPGPPPSLESDELKLVHHNVHHLHIFTNDLPETNLSFQNVLNKSSVHNAPTDQAPSNNSTSNSKESGSNLTTATPTKQADQSSQIITSTSDTLVSSQSESSSIQGFSNKMDFDTIGMNVAINDFRIKESEQGLEMLGSDLPLPEESKQDLSEFDFHIED